MLDDCYLGNKIFNRFINENEDPLSIYVPHRSKSDKLISIMSMPSAPPPAPPPRMIGRNYFDAEDMARSMHRLTLAANGISFEEWIAYELQDAKEKFLQRISSWSENDLV